MDARKKITIDYRRQTDLFDPAGEANGIVTIIGLGNIGSHVATTLARLGIQGLVLFDHDMVEVHNLTSQGYDVNDLGKNKVSAMAAKLEAINPDVLIDPIPFKFDAKLTNPQSKIYVIAVDTMVARKKIHAQLVNAIAKGHMPSPSHIIDGRIGGGQMEVYVCSSLGEWMATFVNNPAPDPCGGRFISYVSVMIGGVITNQVKRILLGKPITKSLMLHTDTMEVVKNFTFN